MHPRTLRLPIIALALLVALALPVISHAQNADELRATIRAQIMSDPRSSSLSSAQIDSMVDLLATAAQKQGVTAQDLTWQPQTFSSSGQGAAALETCAGNFTCIMDEAFGFVGPDATIPFFLGMGSMGLLWVLAEMMHRRKYPHLFR